MFHAGTQTQDDNIVTHCGRVLCVSALGNTIDDAIQLAYAGVDHISWQDMIFRQDIGWRAIDR